MINLSAGSNRLWSNLFLDEEDDFVWIEKKTNRQKEVRVCVLFFKDDKIKKITHKCGNEDEVNWSSIKISMFDDSLGLSWSNIFFHTEPETESRKFRTFAHGEWTGEARETRRDIFGNESPSFWHSRNYTAMCDLRPHSTDPIDLERKLPSFLSTKTKILIQKSFDLIKFERRSVVLHEHSSGMTKVMLPEFRTREVMINEKETMVAFMGPQNIMIMDVK